MITTPTEIGQPVLSARRSSALYLMNEALARAQSRERMREAEHERMLLKHKSAVRLRRKAVRLQRKADRATRRARSLTEAAAVAEL